MSNYERESQLREQAEALFERAYGMARWRGFWARLRRKSRQLPLLSDVLSDEQKHKQHHIGKIDIRVDHIVGSKGGMFFDCEFLPTDRFMADRWVEIAVAMITRPLTLPPLDVDEYQGKFYVDDGHHRVSVARMLNVLYLPADVYRWE